MFHSPIFMYLILLTQVFIANCATYRCPSLQHSTVAIFECTEAQAKAGSCASSYSYESGIWINGVVSTAEDNKNHLIIVGKDPKTHKLSEYVPVKDDGEPVQGMRNEYKKSSLQYARNLIGTLTITQDVVSCGSVTWKSSIPQTIVKKASKRKIAWTPGNYHIWWSPGCEFEGHDFSSIENVDLHTCIDRCALDEKCMDFTLIGKTCHIKSGPYNLTTKDHSHSVKCTRNAFCGWKEEQITPPTPRWNTGEKDVWWSMHCDWTNLETSIFQKSLEDGSSCGALCREHEKSDGCTHFTWNDNDGGKCYLFKDVESTYPENIGGAMCGYLDKAQNGIRRRGTAYCL